jgi:hypothetical protein
MNRKAILFLLAIVPALAIVMALIGVETVGTNLLGWFLLMTGIICAAGIVIVAYIRRETFWESQVNGETVESERGDRSFWLITFVVMAVFYLSPLEYMYLAAQLPRTIWMEVTGAGLVVAGVVLFTWARRELFRAPFDNTGTTISTEWSLPCNPPSCVCRLSLNGAWSCFGIFERGRNYGSFTCADPICNLPDSRGGKITCGAFRHAIL